MTSPGVNVHSWASDMTSRLSETTKVRRAGSSADGTSPLAPVVEPPPCQLFWPAAFCSAAIWALTSSPLACLISGLRVTVCWAGVAVESSCRTG